MYLLPHPGIPGPRPCTSIHLNRAHRALQIKQPANDPCRVFEHFIFETKLKHEVHVGMKPKPVRGFIFSEMRKSCVDYACCEGRVERRDHSRVEPSVGDVEGQDAHHVDAELAILPVAARAELRHECFGGAVGGEERGGLGRRARAHVDDRPAFAVLEEWQQSAAHVHRGSAVHLDLACHVFSLDLVHAHGRLVANSHVVHQEPHGAGDGRRGDEAGQRPSVELLVLRGGGLVEVEDEEERLDAVRLVELGREGLELGATPADQHQVQPAPGTPVGELAAEPSGATCNHSPRAKLCRIDGSQRKHFVEQEARAD
mmetsp:Transcript_22269/g.50368  ORF Transcript_22269/g.50368 Transcript_22269/m.50368 type:complete len:314 (-) Transcript_22269:534-1475(-)